jgi:hydrogenase nickel incorporation protein HypA/HybF
MHETSLLSDMVKKIEVVAQLEGAKRVLEVTVRLGALTQISPGHLREHFVEAVKGTVAEGAALRVVPVDDPSDPGALDIMLDSIEVE